jgi:hypothetical protein
MLLTNLLMHISCLRSLYLWWRRNPATMAVFISLVESPSQQKREARCLWCWNETHVGQPYPYGTSSMCATHRQRERSKLTANRTGRCREEVAV